MTAETNKGTKLNVTFDGQRCIHARKCVLGLPEVFRANVEGPWIHPDSADAQELAALIRQCPSGALQYEAHEGSGITPEQAPPKNTAAVMENGPIAIRAQIDLDGEQPGYRMMLCRCGASKNKPYCDGSHEAAGFEATGEPKPGDDLEPLDPYGGPLTIKPLPNGPVLVNGPLEIIGGSSGHTKARVTKTALCRCGQSSNKPYCDGTHSKVGFEAP